MYKPRKRGKRSGNSTREKELRDIHSRVQNVASHAIKGTTNTARLPDVTGVYNQYFPEENKRDHVVPRKSLTEKLYLEVLPPAMELDTMHGRQLNRTTGRMVETTDQRLVWRRDKSLLVRTKLEHKIPTLKREGLIRDGANTRKRYTVEEEIQPITEVLGPLVEWPNAATPLHAETSDTKPEEK